MSTKVKVVADATSGAVIMQSPNNPEYGYVRLEQVRTMIDENGFLRRKVVSTLIHGTVSELQLTGFYLGQEMPGAIVIYKKRITENPPFGRYVAGIDSYDFDESIRTNTSGDVMESYLCNWQKTIR